MKNWIDHHSTGFLNYTSVLSNSALLLGLPNAPRNLFPNYYHVFYRRSKSGFRVTATLSTLGVVWIRCEFWRTLKISYIQSRSLSSCNIIIIFDFSILCTTIPHSKGKDNLRELIQLCFIKTNGQRRYKYLVLGRDRSYLGEKKHSDFTKKFSETDIINMREFLIVDVFFQQTIAYLWVQTVLLFSPSCSFIRMMQTS